MKVSEFTAKVRDKFPHMAHLDDSDLMFSVAQKKPELLKRVDRDDLAMTMKESQSKHISRERQKTFKSLSGVSRFRAGMGAGMMDVYQGIKQMVGGDTSEFKDDKAAYKEASEGDFAAGAGEIAGAIAATAPVPGFTGAKLATKVASPLAKTAIKAGTALATGAGMGATEFVDEGETRAKNTAYGTLFSAGGALASKMTGKAFNALKGKYKNANVQELMDLAKKHKVEPSLGDLTESQALRKVETLSENVPGMGMAGFREKGAKKVSQAAKGMLDKAKKEMLETGEEMGDDWTRIIQKSGKGVAGERRKQANKLYDKVESLAGDSEAFTKNTKEQVGKMINDAGVLEDDAVTSMLGKLDKGLDGELSFKDLRRLRSKIAAKAEDLSLTNRDASRQLRDLKGAVEKDISSYAEASSPELKSAWKEADQYYKKQVVPLKDKMLAKALKTDEPDQIYKKFIQRGGGDRADKFYNALEEKGRSAVRFGMLSDAYEKSSKSGVFSPKTFNSRLNDLADAKGVFFKGEQKKELKGFQKLMEHSERFGQFAENPPTGQRIAQMLGAASYLNPAVPGSALGIRLLSSKAGKRLILAASEIEPGSDKMAKLIKKFQDNLPKTTAVTAKEIED